MGRAPCCDKNGLKKGPWTPEEDHKLIDYIQKHGYGNWRTLPKNAGLQRCGKSCRLRWTNYLRPDIKRGRFSFEEEETIIQLHSILGNKWSAIASRLPGRTDNEIKNYWNTHIRKRLLRMGIDPVTHSPRLDLLDLSSILTQSLYANANANSNSSSQINFQRILNPDLLKLASSLISSQQQNYNTTSPQIHHNHNSTNYSLQYHHHHHPSQQYSVQQFNNNSNPSCVSSLPSSSLTQPQQLVELSNNNNVNTYSHQISDTTNWHTNGQIAITDEDFNNTLSQLSNYSNNNYYSSDNTQNNLIIDPSSLSEASTFHSNFSFAASVMSTPSSSPTTMNSASTYNNNNINGSITTEDERESYGSCNNIFKFEIPDVLDVSQFM